MLQTLKKRHALTDTNHVLQHLSSPTMECRRNYSVSSCNHVVHYIYPLLFSPTVNRPFRYFDSLDGLLRKYSSSVQDSVVNVRLAVANH